ncbi:Uncharacterised protein [Amycolatopsis camponoti]|uniref:Uncharacterized protein n=1 Tax=Amycolatopsis camponoti TaxID=2606593 RepID=A0A6I8M436_9PSEU|nr:Uncharacterised protein [Amycolatopsis camponoti]
MQAHKVLRRLSWLAVKLATILWKLHEAGML